MKKLIDAEDWELLMKTLFYNQKQYFSPTFPLLSKHKFDSELKKY